MYAKVKQLIDTLTLSELSTLKLQTCWQVAKYLGVTYNRNYTAETVRALIKDILFPAHTEMSDYDSDSESLVSQLGSMALFEVEERATRAEVSLVSEPSVAQFSLTPSFTDTIVQSIAGSMTQPNTSTVYTTPVFTYPRPDLDSLETAGPSVRPKDRPDHVNFPTPPLPTGPISQEQFERLERLIMLQTAQIEAQRKLNEEDFQRENVRLLRQQTDISQDPFNVQKAASMVPKFFESDLDTYFDVFENQARAMNWPRKHWATLLHTALTGRAQTCTSALPFAKYISYDAVKQTILETYNLLPVSYQRAFRTLQRRQDQTCVEFAREKKVAFERWTRAAKCTNYDSLVQLLHEEFNNCMSADIQEYLIDHTTSDILETAVR
ncbi:uncharacterized protein [Cherax quadricarinatus]|uniref:uncharacterized protein n=1 Tax=Cherax quadricarinatus TaxID=27406 RepID=UPI00387E5555